MTPYTLNEVQRQRPALAAKEKEGWWCGSISTMAFVYCHLEAQPSLETLALLAIEKLEKLGITTSVAKILDLPEQSSEEISSE